MSKIHFECRYCEQVEPIDIVALSSHGFRLECSVCHTGFTFGIQEVDSDRNPTWAKCPECLGIMGTHSETCKQLPQPHG
jgi:hypothetical protein